MTCHIALLRGINVGGHKTVAMSDLRERLARLGFRNVQSLLNSGNLVFESEETPAQIEKTLEKEIQTDVLVRTADDLETVIRRNPFPAEAKTDPSRLVVLFTKTPVDAKKLEIAGRETAKGSGREIYIFYPDGQGTSKLTNTAIEKQLGTRCTARNWNTVMKLLGAVSG